VIELDPVEPDQPELFAMVFLVAAHAIVVSRHDVKTSSRTNAGPEFCMTGKALQCVHLPAE
jgi:hypothetical protein